MKEDVDNLDLFAFIVSKTVFHWPEDEGAFIDWCREKIKDEKELSIIDTMTDLFRVAKTENDINFTLSIAKDIAISLLKKHGV